MPIATEHRGILVGATYHMRHPSREATMVLILGFNRAYWGRNLLTGKPVKNIAFSHLGNLICPPIPKRKEQE